MDIPAQYTSLQYVHDICWRDVFAVWRSHEAYQKDWEEHWIERGFDSWDAWRTNYIAPLEPTVRQWGIYRIENLSYDISLMYGVPSRGWQQTCYGGERTKMIADILVHKVVAENVKIHNVLHRLPYQTMLMGIVHEERIVLVDGMHRACALAQSTKNFVGDVVIALTEHDGDIPLIGNGSQNV